jgi:hypothetical protein
MRPPSTQNDAKAMISSRSGRSPVVSRSTTTNRAARHGVRGPSSAAVPYVSIAVGSSHASRRGVAEAPLDAGHGAERVAHVPTGQIVQRFRIDEVVGR